MFHIIKQKKMVLKKQIAYNNASEIQTQSLLSLNLGITARSPHPPQQSA